MTKAEAIKELMRCAEICPTTPLAEACRMAVEALGERWESVGRALGERWDMTAMTAVMLTGCRQFIHAVSAM